MRKMIFLILSVVICLSMTAPAYANAEKGNTMISSMKPSGVKAVSYNYSKIRVSWDAVEGADGYIVYRASSENGTYRKSYTTDNPKKNWYINTNENPGRFGGIKFGHTNLLTERKSSQNTPSQSVLMPDRGQ